MLHRLPVELLLNIAPFLDIDENDGVDYRQRPNHDSLRQCSRHLYEIFTPLRFRDIEIRMTNVFSADGFWPQRPEGLPVVYFTKLLVRKPHFAGYVRSLELHAYPGHGPEFRLSPIEPAPSRAEYGRIVKSVACSEPDSKKWLDDLLSGNEDAFIALLLVQLKNLDTLELDIPEADQCPHLTRVIQRAAEPEACGYFSKLKSVCLHKGPTWEDYSGDSHMALSRLVPFFHLPSIRRFQTGNVSTVASPAWPAGFFDRKSSLASIELYRMPGVSPDFPDLISLCTRLESFEYGSPFCSDDEGNEIFHPAAFYSPLKHSISTLRTLSLKLYPYRPPTEYPTPEFSERRFFGSLSDFSALENVRMRMCDLIPFRKHSWEPAAALTEVLPASLRVLHITHVYVEALPHLIAGFSDMVRHRNSRFRRLKTLVLHPLGMYTRGPYADWTEPYLAKGFVPQWTKDLVVELAPKVLELKAAFESAGGELALVSPYNYDRRDFP